MAFALGTWNAMAAAAGTAAAESAGVGAVAIGFETGDWKGLELSTNQVKTGKHSGLWKDHPLNNSVSTGNIPHDWSGFDGMRLWIYNATPRPVSMMVVLTSRSDPKIFSYFSSRLTVAWEGWKEVAIPFSRFGRTRAPAGWNQIDSISFTVAGWGIKPDPEAVLYLDGLALVKAAVKIAAPEQLAEMAVAKKQFRDYQREAWKMATGAGKDEELVAAWLKSLAADGTWPDVNYADQTSGYWRTSDHLSRLNKMCMAYTSPEGRLHGDPALSKAIHAALGHWLQMDYRNPNWWHSEIGVPRELSTIMLLLDAELSPRERAAGIRIVSRAVIDSPPYFGGRGLLTGQNRVWVAANALTRGLLTSDFELVQHARQVIFEEVAVATQAGGHEPKVTRGGSGVVLLSTQDGIQPDFSFFQHGPQLQLGNYGLGFAGDIVMWLTVLRDTSLALDQHKLGIVRDYLLKGESTVVWKGVMDINACGRQLGPQSPRGKGREVLRILATAKVADAAHAAEYQAAMDRDSASASATNIPASNKYFWRADFMVHRRPGYYVSTRMSSARTYASELVNGENLQGGYLGDGATYVYLTGREYDDIFPVWDWSRLPGVTSPSITDKTRLKPRNWRITNPSEFVGGVSDGEYGVAALALNRDGLVAQKGWFYFDDQIVCLGAGISGNEPLPITTGINQCLARGDITVESGKGPGTPPAGLQEYATLKWAWHDHVGYIFPEPLTLILGSQEQAGRWNEVASSGGNQSTATAKVFSIWINHGARPQADHYSYVVLPGASVATVEAQVRAPEVTILGNTAALQAVRHARLKMTQAIFYEPGTLAYAAGKTIAVDKPCVLLLNEKTNRLTLADPTQKLAEITVRRNGAAVKCALPAGAQAGSSFTAF
ncbi:MAG: polysaccharide lyase family 8 super-sandwich domain-containing protein [Lentisphaeria bacterium]